MPEPEVEEAVPAAADTASLPVEAWRGRDPAVKAALATVGLPNNNTPAPSENDLRKCFHRAALKWHPDKNPSAEAKANCPGPRGALERPAFPTVNR
jgi:hypothetical protein